MTGTLSFLDFAVIALYLLLVTALGVMVHQRNRSREDFLFAGKSMGWIPIGISIAAAFISGISYVGLPTEVYSYGLNFMLYVLAYLLVIPVILYFFLPFYGGVRITTAYEYLESRFDRRTRQICSGMFIGWRLLWMATVIYVPSLLTSTMTGLPLLPSVLVIGILTTIYTAFGGLRGVILTDVMQFFIMVGGALAAIQFAAQAVPGGVTGIWSVASEQGRLLNLDFSFDLSARMTVWGALTGGFFANLSFFGVDQMVIQRYLATRTASEMRSTFLLNCLSLFLVVTVLAGLGLALFAFYRTAPGGLPAGVPSDRVLLHFIGIEFPPGLRGLLVASILAASMSTLSAGVNAVTAALCNDFRNMSNVSEGAGLQQIRWMSIGVGLLATLIASQVGTLGSVIEVAVRVVDSFAGPLLGVFLIGMLSQRIGSGPAIAGVFAGLAATGYANFASSISFVWFPALGCLVTMLVAWLTNPLLGRRT